VARREGALWAWRTPTLGPPDNTHFYGHPMTQIKRCGCGIHLALARPSITDHHAALRRLTPATRLPLAILCLSFTLTGANNNRGDWT
jgi:hypothetical protein